MPLNFDKDSILYQPNKRTWANTTRAMSMRLRSYKTEFQWRHWKTLFLGDYGLCDFLEVLTRMQWIYLNIFKHNSPVIMIQEKSIFLNILHRDQNLEMLQIRVLHVLVTNVYVFHWHRWTIASVKTQPT